MTIDLENLQQFTGLDPAAGREPTEAEWNRSKTGVEQAMTKVASARVVTPGRLAVGLVAAAALGVGAIMAVPALFPSATARAIADWTPTPGSLTGRDVLPQAKACARGGVGGLDDGTVTADQVILADQRGSATMLIMKQGTAMALCLMVGPEDRAAALSLDESQPATPARPITVETYSSRGDGDTEYSSVIGRVDPSVTGVEVILNDGQVIRTSAKATWWGGWWPGPAGGEADGFTVRVHTARGTVDYRPSQLTGG